LDQTHNPMAITKTIVKRRCPVTGTVTRSSKVFFHGILALEEKEFIKEIIKLVKSLCPDPDGSLSFKVFYQTLMKDFPRHKFDKEQLTIIKKYVRNLLNIVLDHLSKEESKAEEEVVFLKETTLEERNKIGFENAIVIS